MLKRLVNLLLPLCGVGLALLVWWGASKAVPDLPSPMAIAIVDTAGDLVYFEKMDDTQAGSVQIAQSKARSAARFKRATKVFQDGLAAGGVGLRLLALEGAVPVEGGIPLVSGGKIVGAIGASGGTSEQDGMVAQAGASALT